MKSISIVMTYYNRPNQLALTLKSLKKSSLIQDTQIIVVDDASDLNENALPVIAKSGLDVDVILVRVSKKEKTWKGPCIAYNRGFEKATGEITIIQNAECFHVGDILLHAANNVTDKNYLTYSCLSINQEVTNQINSLWDNDFEKVLDCLGFIRIKHHEFANGLGWLNHALYRPAALHWTSAIATKNLKELGGFDERYKDGYSYDDNDLLLRIKIKGLLVEIISEEAGYVVHQPHPRTNRGRNNRKLFFKLLSEYEKKLGREFGGHHAKEGGVFLLGQ